MAITKKRHAAHGIEVQFPHFAGASRISPI
jgi:hypothetical protein